MHFGRSSARKLSNARRTILSNAERLEDRTMLAGDLLWSDLRMDDGLAPDATDVVVIEDDTRVILDQNAEVKGLIIRDGTFTVQDGSDLSFTTDYALVMAGSSFEVGSEANPHDSNFTLTLTGDDPNFDLNLADHTNGQVQMVVQNNNAYLMAMGANAQIELHAADASKMSWTQINATASPGDTTLTLAEAPGWEIGDRIGLASTDFDATQSEEFTITDISPDGRTLTLDSPVQYMHYGEVDVRSNGKSGADARTWDIDMRAEVALLTRNVTIQGDEDSYTDGFGGHTMVMNGGVMHVDGVAFESMGQEGRLGRYATHWHLLGDVSGQYVKNSSFNTIHHNGIQIHGSSSALVLNNAVWGPKESGVFFEDGNETGNRIEGNLSVKLDNFSNAETEEGANYWIEHPDNEFVGNHAVGGATGFFFRHEFGPGKFQSGPTLFDGNVAHGNKWGLYIKNMNGNAITDPDYTVNDFTAYKTVKGVFARTQGGTFNDLKVADTFEGVYLRLNQNVYHSVFVGRSDNVGTPVTPEEIAQGRTLADNRPGFYGVSNYDGPFTLDNVHFDEYYYGDGTKRFEDAALGSHSGVDKTFNNVVNRLSFGANVEDENKVWMTTGQLDGAWSATGVYDLDGSLTGTPNTTVSADIYNEGGSDITGGINGVEKPEWRSIISPGETFARFEIRADGPFEMTRSDGEVYRRSYGQKQFMMLLDESVSHDILLRNDPVQQVRFEFTEMKMGDSLTYKFSTAHTMADVRVLDPASNQETKAAEVRTFEELENATTTAFWRDQDGIHIRVVAEQTGAPHYVQPGITPYGQGVTLGGVFFIVDTENLVDPSEIVYTEFPQEQEVGFSGTATGVTGNWKTINLPRTFTNPIVVAGGSSTNGSHHGEIRVRNVGPDSFQIRFEEWDYLDGGHAAENVGYLVVEQGTHTLTDGTQLVAGKTNLQNESFTTVTYGSSFSSTPLVFGQVMTTNDSAAVVERIQNVNSNTFQIQLQEEEAADGIHATEEVGYIAIDQGAATSGEISLNAVRTANVVTDGNRTIDFGDIGGSASPVILTDAQTRDGADVGLIRHRSSTSTSVTVFFEEEKSRDSELAHTTEVAGVLALEPGILLAAQALTASSIGVGATSTLDQSDVDGLVDDAIGYWSYLGYDTRILANVNFVVADLKGATIGLQTANTIYLDVDAAGHGWYVDNDTSTTEQFDGMDLYTAIAHELGHVLGLADLYDSDDSDDAMYAFLAEGERRATLEDSLEEAFQGM